MEYTTTGIRTYLEKYFQVFYASPVDASSLDGVPDRLKMIYISGGSCSLGLKNERLSIISPALILADEQTRLDVLGADNAFLQVLLFHPSYINSRFDFPSLRNGRKKYSLTDQQDAYNLDVFLKNGVKVFNALGLNAAFRVAGFFNSLGDTLLRQTHGHWPCVARCTLLEFLFYLGTLSDDGAGNAWMNRIVFRETRKPGATIDIGEVLSYLNTNYGEKITVEKLADGFHTNRTTLSSEFKKATGLSLLEYLSKIRIQIASSLLQNSVLKVYEIMDKVGYQDSSNFLRAFKKNTGHTPARFRKLNTWIKR